MFNFTSTTFIHSEDLFEANPNNTSNTFRVNGVNLFKKEDIVGIYRNPYTAPVNGQLLVNVTRINNAYINIANNENLPAIARAHFRLNFYLRRSGDNNSYYANDMVFKGKDFHYEWTGYKNATQLAKIFTKINKLYGDIFLKISVRNGTLLVFENDNYGLFTEASVEFWEEGSSDCCTYKAGNWRAIDELDPSAVSYPYEGEDNCTYLVKNSSTLQTETRKQINQYTDSRNSGLEASSSLRINKCVNGTGTYWQIMKDLRLPTAENDGPWSITAQLQELPIPGNMYVQYTLHYISCRGVLGGSAVGEVTHSKTTHVFFVPADCCECATTGMDSKFLKALGDAGLTSLVVDVEAGVVGSGTNIPQKTDPTINPVKATEPVASDESFAITNKTLSTATPDDDPGLSSNSGKATAPMIETPKEGMIPAEATSKDKNVSMSLPYNMPIYYTIDNSEPTVESTPYTEPLSGTDLLDDNEEITLKAAAGRNAEELSASVSVELRKAPAVDEIEPENP